MTPEHSERFKGRVHGDLVFRTPRDRAFYIGQWNSQKKKWLDDHPESWQPLADALSEQAAAAQAFAEDDIEAKPAEPSSPTWTKAVRTAGESDGPSPAPGEDKRLPAKPALAAEPLTNGDRKAASTAGGEIIIGAQRFISERRLAVMLGRSLRQLQRWRKQQSGPPSTKIGRTPYYEMSKLDEWLKGDSPYYITPDGQVGQDAFAVIREMMRGKGMVALARVVLAKRERVIMLQPWDKGLMGTTLRYPYEIRDAKDYFDDIPDVKVQPEMMKLAEHILHNKAGDFDPSQFVDHYEEAVREMLKQTQAGIAVSRQQATLRPQNVVNLMDALRRSIAKEKAVSAPPKRGRKRITGQTEMLLLIPGKKGKEAGTKTPGRASAQKKAG
jgi:DNA end-binding protein Ku